jgi:hypothetical protein
VHGLLFSGSAPAGYAPGDAWAQGAAFAGVLDDDGNPTVDPQTGILYRSLHLLDRNWGNEGDGSDPTVFAGGNKNSALIGPSDEPWEWDGGGGGPQKNDLTNAYLHTRLDPVTGDRWVFVGGETRSTNGDSHVDFEFNQAGIVQIGATDGELVGLGPDGGRTINDFLISIDFEQGGEAPVATVRFWSGSSYELVAIPDTGFSATNFADIAHGANGSWKHFASDGTTVEVISRLQFVEGGVNLTALGIAFDACAPEATFAVKTRSSSSFTADLKDYILLHFPLEPPPEVEVLAAADLACPGETIEFTALETTGLANPVFAWEVIGCGTILGDPNASVITVQAGADCNCDITARVTVTGGECDHLVVAEKTVTIRDDVQPVTSGVPADETVECDAIPDPPEVTATDGCSAAAVELSESVEPGLCLGEATITRTWTATDDCGNQTSQSQFITVEDTTSPVLSGVPADETVECDSIPDPPIVTATDNCSAALVEVSENIEPGLCDGAMTITRTWTATDDCGNQTSQSQVITVQDTTAPLLSGVPADETVECDSIPDPPSVTATDNCSDVAVELSENTEPGHCDGALTITRTWTATDACGNQTSASQVITVQDTTAPVLSGVPADGIVECDSIPEPPQVTATDNCSDPLVELSESVEPGPCNGATTITRTWTATDDCGNQTSASQVISVQNTTAPVLIGMPADETVECDSIPDPPEVTASDNCSTATVELSESVEFGACDGAATITRTWTATDECGNQSSQSQVITVQDTTAPVLSGMPADETVECDSVPEAAVVSATDNCSEPVVELSESTAPGSCDNEYTITRTWTATDDCGNESSHTQVVTAALLSGVPADETVECDSVPQPAEVSAADNCDGDVPVEFGEETIPGACTGEYTVLRTWTATDDCGNAASAGQALTVQDTTPPVISMEPSQSDLYICDGPASALVQPEDNCGPVVAGNCSFTADFPERVILEDLGSGVFHITLTGNVTVELTCAATDDCGNTSGDYVFSLTAQCGKQACSPGYWRNHIESWCLAGFNPFDDYCFTGPATLFVDAFGITDFSSPEIPGSFDPGITLLQALNGSGGDFNQLLFQGSAALLSAASPLVDFPATVCEIRQVMRDAFAGIISIDEARAFIGAGNAAEGECGCPFSGGLPTTYECEGDELHDPCAGDMDGDGDVDYEDYASFYDCMNGPNVMPAPTSPTTATDCLAAFDFDEDADVDLADFGDFQKVAITP